MSELLCRLIFSQFKNIFIIAENYCRVNFRVVKLMTYNKLHKINIDIETTFAYNDSLGTEGFSRNH